MASRQSGESRALKSVLRNHAEGYALLCFHLVGGTDILLHACSVMSCIPQQLLLSLLILTYMHQVMQLTSTGSATRVLHVAFEAMVPYPLSNEGCLATVASVKTISMNNCCYFRCFSGCDQPDRGNVCTGQWLLLQQVKKPSG